MENNTPHSGSSKATNGDFDKTTKGFCNYIVERYSYVCSLAVSLLEYFGALGDNKGDEPGGFS